MKDIPPAAKVLMAVFTYGPVLVGWVVMALIWGAVGVWLSYVLFPNL